MYLVWRVTRGTVTACTLVRPQTGSGEINYLEMYPCVVVVVVVEEEEEVVVLVCVCECVCVCIRVYMRTYIRMCVWLYACMNVRMYVRTYVCMYVFMCTHIYIRISLTLVARQVCTVHAGIRPTFASLNNILSNAA